ncbi:desmoplakin-like [Electrophorus electricus]|uniref:desmoplakin-like n=1 Tax=Electrophorus electricus TaxID=8005 RepID=UPI0015D03B9E|nr:desmoplakin-like [Electrophorus electricus]
MEKNLANQKVQEHKVEMNNLNMALQKATGEAQKESSEGKKNMAKLRELENEILRYQQTINRMTGSSEKAAVSLKQDIASLQKEKQAADQKLQTLKTEYDELNFTLKKTKDELLRLSQEGKINQSKIKEMEAELQKNRLTMKELSSNSDKYTANLKQECSNLLKGKSAAEEKNTTLATEISQLKKKLEQTQGDLMQKQNETAAAKLKSQMLEEHLENCKRMLEDLKGKLELQKKGYETQLHLVHSEMEQKLALQDSRMKLDYERKSKECSHSTETIERDNKHLLQEIEQLKAMHIIVTKTKQEIQQQLDSLHAQLERTEKQKGAVELELLKAKSKITELESEKIKMKSSISQIDNVSKENSKETTRLKQMLKQREQKLEIAENEAKSVKEQVASYIKEVKSLQEKNLKLEVTINSGNKCLKEAESLSQTSHQCAKDSELAKLKTELILTQKIVSSYEEAKQKLEEELNKIKLTSEIATLEKDKALEELKKVKQYKMERVNSRVEERRITENTVLNLTTPENQSKPLISSSNHSSEHTSIVRKSSRSDKGKSGKIHSVTFDIITSESSCDDSTDLSKIDQTESSTPKFQGLRGRISIKKLIKTKIITHELALKLEKGLITMEELEALLGQFTGKPASIAGIYLESRKKKLSFMEAAEAGLMAKTYAVEFLEAQAATGAIIDPTTGESYTSLDALDKGIISGSLRDKITDADKAVSGYPHGGKILSVFQAMEERIVDRHRGKGIIEAQIATGGLIHPLIGMRVPLECAIEQGLINQAMLHTLFDPVSNPKSFHNPETGQRAYYIELLKKCVYDITGGVYLLPFGEHHISSFSPASTHRVSVINSATGAEMSTYEAYKANLIDRRTYLFLSQQESEWQEITSMDSDGNPLHILTDQKSGREFCIETALSLKILQTSELDSYRSGQLSIFELADLLISRKVVIKDTRSPISGLWDVALKKRLSILKGLQQNLVDRLTAFKLLEAQACTGGICDPATGVRVQIAEALRQGLLDENFARQMQQYEQAYYGIIHPKTGKTLTVTQAMHENLLSKDVGHRCLEYQLATGGLIDPETHDRVSVEEAIQNCLIDKITAAQLKDDHLHAKSITCPKTKRKISFKEALEKGVFDSHTGLLLLEAKPRSAGATSSFQYIWTYRHF